VHLVLLSVGLPVESSWAPRQPQVCSIAVCGLSCYVLRRDSDKGITSDKATSTQEVAAALTGATVREHGQRYKI
jgi:hypothetical protein